MKPLKEAIVIVGIVGILIVVILSLILSQLEIPQKEIIKPQPCIPWYGPNMCPIK